MADFENYGKSVPAAISDNKAFLRHWSEINEDTFEEVMKEIRLENPIKWAELYLKVSDKFIPPPQPPKTDSKINILNIENKDLATLQALANHSMRVTKPNDSLRSNYVDYEESNI